MSALKTEVPVYKNIESLKQVYPDRHLVLVSIDDDVSKGILISGLESISDGVTKIGLHYSPDSWPKTTIFQSIKNGLGKAGVERDIQLVLVPIAPTADSVLTLKTQIALYKGVLLSAIDQPHAYMPDAEADYEALKILIAGLNGGATAEKKEIKVKETKEEEKVAVIVVSPPRPKTQTSGNYTFFGGSKGSDDDIAADKAKPKKTAATESTGLLDPATIPLSSDDDDSEDDARCWDACKSACGFGPTLYESF